MGITQSTLADTNSTDINSSIEDKSIKHLTSDELGKQMCQYFIDFHKRLNSMESELTKTIVDFNHQIEQLPLDQQVNYEKYKDIMQSISSHYGEGDWIQQTYLGDEFGSHYLGLHNKYNPDCIYCQDTKKHNEGLHENDNDEYCIDCKDARKRRSGNIINVST